jgi:hypothetical protein
MISLTAWNEVFGLFEVDVEGETLYAVVIVLRN